MKNRPKLLYRISDDAFHFIQSKKAFPYLWLDSYKHKIGLQPTKFVKTKHVMIHKVLDRLKRSNNICFFELHNWYFYQLSNFIEFVYLLFTFAILSHSFFTNYTIYIFRILSKIEHGILIKKSYGSRTKFLPLNVPTKNMYVWI